MVYNTAVRRGPPPPRRGGPTRATGYRYTSDARTSSVCALYAQIREIAESREERGPLGVRNVCHVSTVVLAQRALTEETLDEAKSVKLKLLSYYSTVDISVHHSERSGWAQRSEYARMAR